jgi:hypothetical protein
MAAVALLVLILPAASEVPAITDGAVQSYEPSRTGPSGECPPLNNIWYTGMYDMFTPPAGCSSAISAGCFVNADTTGSGGFGNPGYRLLADDWLAMSPDAVTHIKFWARVNEAAVNLGYDGDTPAPMLKGFCVKFYEGVYVGGSDLWCPDGSMSGETAIGTEVYSAYSSVWNQWFVTGGLPRNWAYCVQLPSSFFPTVDKWYWVSVAPDFDFQYDPISASYSQMFNRVCPSDGYSLCEGMWWDGWSNGSAAAWLPISMAADAPCWAGWDLGFVLYSGPPGPTATEPTSWGRLKAIYR